MENELFIAKSIIADQQIALTSMRSQLHQLSDAYLMAPDGSLVHARCGEPGLDITSKTPTRVCGCYSQKED